MGKERVWTMTIAFTEDEDKTRADAFLSAGAMELRGWGRSRRNPVDPDVPVVGEEIAAARAMHDIADKLLERATMLIEDWEGRPVRVQG